MQIAKSYKSLHLKNRKSVISTLLCITDLFDVAIYEISDIRFAICCLSPPSGVLFSGVRVNAYLP